MSFILIDFNKYLKQVFEHEHRGAGILIVARQVFGDDVLPCPFCGSNDIHMGYCDGFSYHIKCKGCRSTCGAVERDEEQVDVLPREFLKGIDIRHALGYWDIDEMEDEEVLQLSRDDDYAKAATCLWLVHKKWNTRPDTH